MKPRDIHRNWLKLRSENEAENGEGTAVTPKENKVIDKLICLIGTNEPHLRRAIERRSDHWVEFKGKMQGIFDIRFEFQDQQSDYSNLKSSQMFNHFQGNMEITSKSGLCKSLYQNNYCDM